MTMQRDPHAMLISPRSSKLKACWYVAYGGIFAMKAKQQP
jgi:hypothetical protein